MSLPTPFYEADGITIFCGDAKSVLSALPDESINCCVTSPPYWGLRDYQVAGQIGLEPTPAEYVASLVAVFQEVKRVLCDDGALWLNIGDTYCNSDKWGGGGVNTGKHTKAPDGSVPSWITVRRKWAAIPGLKPKDMIGIPWLVAFALRADGWYLRQEIIWSKPNPMPESVTDRCTKSHEQIFLLTKAANYHYDADAIAEPVAESTNPRIGRANSGYAAPGQTAHHGIVGPRPNTNNRGSYRGSSFNRGKTGVNGAGRTQPDDERGDVQGLGLTRNKRSVWTVTTQGFKEAHFATFPPNLIKPCILAGCPVGGVVLDPFLGSGTTAMVAVELGRKCVGIELNPDYAAMAVTRSDVTKGLPL